ISCRETWPRPSFYRNTPQIDDIVSMRCEKFLAAERVDWRAAPLALDSALALTATIYTFDIDLANADRGVYEKLALRVARHPSESEDYLVTRVLAYCLEHTEGIAFS